MNLTIKQALAAIKAGKSLKGIVLQDLDQQQVNVRDALTLARAGIVIPEERVFYDDADIVYDPDIDEVDWSDDFVEMTLEDKAALTEQYAAATVSLSLSIPDPAIREWVRANPERIARMLQSVIKGLYDAEQRLKEEM